MSVRTAILAGATGLVGMQCLETLLNCPEYDRVIAVVRRPLMRNHAKLRQEIVDFESLGALKPDAADVFCALGTTIRKAGSREAFRRVDHVYPTLFAQRALDAGARQFALISSVGASAKSTNFYLSVKGETENALSAMPFEAIHVFRPSFLLGDRSESRPGERAGIAAAALVSPLLAGPLKKYRPIEAAKVARAMVRAALGGKPGRHIYHWPEIIALGS